MSRMNASAATKKRGARVFRSHHVIWPSSSGAIMASVAASNTTPPKALLSGPSLQGSPLSRLHTRVSVLEPKEASIFSCGSKRAASTFLSCTKRWRRCPVVDSQTSMLPSTAKPASNAAEGENPTQYTGDPCVMHRCFSPDVASQMHTVPLSSLVASRSPLASKAAAVASSVKDKRRTSFPVRASHTRAVVSGPAVAMTSRVGLKSMTCRDLRPP